MGILKDAWTVLPHVLNFFTLLFLCLSCGLVSWSVMDIETRNGVAPAGTGTGEIGIWRACSDMTNKEVAVFTTVPGSSCRQGHCVKRETLAGLRSGRSEEGLCDRASAVGAFAILAILCCVIASLMTTFRAIMGRTVLWWKGTLYNCLGVFCSLLAWAIWAAWQSQINDQETLPSDSIVFGDFEYGAGFGLQVTSFVFMGINAYACRMQYKDQQRQLAKQRAAPNRVPLAGAGDSVYQEGDQTTGTTGGAMGRTATRRKPDDNVIIMSHTTAVTGL
eukprot:m.89091 g.89091  ORF g.89091 m.89091 type:complete len:276 (-) comp9784_c2_seq1:121-948(-)